jgi:plastocyanin
MPDGDVYNVKLASNVKPGTYRYYCTLHTVQMQGAITVVPSGDKAPTAAENKATGDAELQKGISALQPAVDAVKDAPVDKALAGVGTEEAEGASANIFGPPIATIPVGGSVNWTIFGPHTISFNPPDDLEPFITRAPDGLVHLNPKTFPPAGGGVPQPQPPGGDQGGGGGGGSTTTTAAVTTTTSGAPPPPTVVDGGSYNGTGYYSTGLYLSFPPELSAYKMTFTKAGTYSYECLLHPGMAGAVKVG